MAVTGKDKVFVVNENTNTKYGGVDPSGSFKTIDELRGYKVYTALITQSGGDKPESQSHGNVEQGVSYTLTPGVEESPWDFSNVGGPKFPEDWSFVATSNNVPNEYGGKNLSYNTGAPLVTVLENTIGNIWFYYSSNGEYYGVLPEPYPMDKLAGYLGTDLFNINGKGRLSNWNSNNDPTIDFNIQTANGDGELLKTFLEIRIYN